MCMLVRGRWGRRMLLCWGIVERVFFLCVVCVCGLGWPFFYFLLFGEWGFSFLGFGIGSIGFSDSFAPALSFFVFLYV